MSHDSEHINISMCVLDVLQYDIETMDSIIRLLNDDSCIGWRHLMKSNFTVQVVMPYIKKLVDKGLVSVYEESNEVNKLLPVKSDDINIDAKIGEYWYLITPAGHKVWSDWNPPEEAAETAAETDQKRGRGSIKVIGREW